MYDTYKTIVEYTKSVILLAVIVVAVSPTQLLQPKAAADAPAQRWAHQGAAIVPRSSEDFASAQMQVSLSDLRSTGANEVELVIPIYQHHLTDCTFYARSDTPSTSSVASAVAMAHTYGLKAILKFHAESDDTSWRNYINATDRQCWFTNYAAQLTNYLRSSGGADGTIIATEMHRMFGTSFNPTNAANVRQLVSTIRANFGGTVTYDSNQNGESDMFDIDWSLFDYIGLSCYWPLSNDLTASWNSIVSGTLDVLHNRYPTKTVACTEVGYRSVSGAHFAPWDYTVSGAVDYTEQANDYQALFNMLNSRSYMSGVDFWNWRVDYDATDVGPTEFTPQKKPAQQVMTANFTAQPPAPDPIDAAYPAVSAILGAPTASEVLLSGGNRMRTYQYGNIYWSPATGAHEVHGSILAKYLSLGGPAAYGFPTSNETATSGVSGRYNTFSGGKSIYWSGQTGAHEVHGLILTKYLQSGGPAGYGFPVTDETTTPDQIGRYNHFTLGRSIYWTPATGAHTIYGAIRDKWASMGWERSYLGYPTTDEYSVPGGRQNNFQNNHYIFWNASSWVITVR